MQKSIEMALEDNNVQRARLRLFGHVQKRDSVHCSVDPEDGDVGRRKTG